MNLNDNATSQASTVSQSLLGTDQTSSKVLSGEPPAEELTKLQPFTAKMSERRILNEKFQSLRFELVEPSRLRFTAGQYILLTVPTTPQKKSYSITTSPSTEHAFELMIELAPQGHGVKYLTSLQPGDEIKFMAPVGLFTLAAPESPIGQAEKAFVFIATGSGIAPFKSILEDLLISKNEQRPIILYWGLRYAEDQFWFNEFQQLAQQHKNFTFHPTLSKAPDNWQLCRGRVTDCLLIHPMPVEQAGYYLCGSSAMIGDVKELLTKQGVPAQHIHHEKFY
jgi:ferredoxin-NADP reductase